MYDTVHIASLIVQVRPDNMKQARKTISQLNNVEVHGEGGGGKHIVVLEEGNTKLLSQRITEIEQISGVVNVLLIYHQSEDIAALEATTIIDTADIQSR